MPLHQEVPRVQFRELALLLPGHQPEYAGTPERRLAAPERKQARLAWYKPYCLHSAVRSPRPWTQLNICIGRSPSICQLEFLLVTHQDCWQLPAASSSKKGYGVVLLRRWRLHRQLAFFDYRAAEKDLLEIDLFTDQLCRRCSATRLCWAPPLDTKWHSHEWLRRCGRAPAHGAGFNSQIARGDARVLPGVPSACLPHHQRAVLCWAIQRHRPTVVLLRLHFSSAQTVRDKCFDKCVTKPSSSLGSSEQQCLARCCDRYAEVSVLYTAPC